MITLKDQFKLMISNEDDYLNTPKAESFPDDEMNEDSGTKENPFNQSSTSNKKSKTPVLDNFGRDLTALAEENKLDPVVGRDKEIQRVSQILKQKKEKIIHY